MSSPKLSRSLVFSEGSSNKFWTIEMAGSSHTVTFGRVGSAGQTQTKEFGDGGAARKSFDKLVAEKLKKGYVDREASVDAGAAPSNPAARKVVKSASDEPEAKPAEKPEAKPSAPKPLLTTPREIALDSDDWFRAGFRPRKRLPHEAPRPFDQEVCLRRLANVKTTMYGWVTRWQDLDLPRFLSPEESQFWLFAMTTHREGKTSMQRFADELASETFTGKMDAEAIHERLAGYPRGLSDEVILVVANLLTTEQLVELLMKPVASAQHWGGPSGIPHALIQAFPTYILPYLSDEEAETLRQRIRRTWDPTRDPAQPHEMYPAEYYLAAYLGMHVELREVTARWENDRFYLSSYGNFFQNPHPLVFGLGSADLVESEWRRLKLKVRSPEDARALLACTEYAALDCLADDIIAETKKEKSDALLEVLTLVHAPEAAVPILRCKLAAKAPARARQWLDQQIGHAVAGLIGTATERGSLGEAALDYLRDVKRTGHAEVVKAALNSCTNEAAVAKVRADVLDFEEKAYEPLDAAMTPAWLTEALAAAGSKTPKKLPGWASPALLPPLLVGDLRLNDEQVTAVLRALVDTPPTSRHPLLVAIREHVERHLRDAFAWKLFQNWQGDGYPTAGKWALAAIGHVGDDGCVLKLTPLVRAWPGESQHARAVFGLECLRAVGTNVALMQLSGIAQKLKFKALKAKAEQFVEEIAQDKGLTRAELEDRVVPDCGLDGNGRREFSFGSRTFSFVLCGDLKPMVRDADGKLRTDLPKPSGKDDEATAQASVAEWKLLKKQIRQVATVQAERLEKAMVAGRRWAPEDFETLLVRHPLMTHLVQKLIWGAYDPAGQRTASFRVTEERDYADVHEESFHLGGVARVGVVHPLELTEVERGAWGQVLGDYEIITPFPQLGRKVYTLEGDEATYTELTRFAGLLVVAPTLIGILEKLGWVRGVAMDGGCFDEHSKQFPAANVTAVLGYDGTVSMGYIDPNEMLTLKTVCFCPGMRPPSGYGWKLEKLLPLGEIPPVVMSEILAHLHVLKSKAK
jgi:predicted DNA-binding WGR domain protein